MKKFFTLLLALVLTAAIGVTMSGCSKELIGFDIELAKAVADKLGVGVSFVEINWDTKEAELDNRSIDAAWNGFTYTKARDEGYFDEDRNQQIGGLDFTGMYMENKQVAVVKKENAEKFGTLEGLKSAKSMVAEAGSAGFTTIQDVFEKEPVPAKKQLDIFTEVSSGASDVGVIDAVMAGYYITSETGAYHESLAVVEIEGVEKEFYAVGCREESNLPAVINHVLAGLWADGTIRKIGEKYGLQDVLVNGFGEYDENYQFPTDGDYAAVLKAKKFVVGYTVFAPMAYKG